MSSTNDSSTNSTLSRFLVTIVLSATLGGIVFAIWLILRTLLPYVYHPRKDEGTPKFSRIPFKWLWDIMKLSDRHLFKSHGPDVVFYFRTVRLQLLLCWVMAITMIALLPINGVGSNKDLSDNDPQKTRQLEIVTSGNIPKGDSSFAAHIVFVYWISLAAYLGIWFTYRQYAKDRARYWFGKNDARCHTILLRGLPATMNEEELREWMNRYVPVEVLAIHLVRKCKGLKKKRKKLAKYSNKLYKANWILEHQKEGKKRPTTRTKFFGKIGKKVDAQEYFTEKKQKWHDKSQARLDDPDHYQRNGAALVTFTSTFPTRCEFNMTALTWEWKGMTAQPAPEPDDILWDSLKIGKVQRIVRIVLVFIFFFLLIFLWSIPVTFIVSIANLGTLSQIDGFGWLSGITDVNIIVRGGIEGFLPSLVLIIFMALLMPIIKFFTWLEGLTSYSQWERKVYNRYFYFLLVNVLLVSTFAGGIFNIVQTIIDNPSSAPELLAQTLPQQSLYFITYIIIACGLKTSLSFLRPVSLIVWIIKRILAKTDKDKEKADMPGSSDLASVLATRMLIFGLVLIYNVMAPLIIPFGILYFTFSYIVDRYNFILCFKRPWDGGGILWQSSFHHFMMLIMLFQGTMIALLAVNQFAPVAALAPLPILTLAVWFSVWHLYHPLGEHGSVMDGWDGEEIDYEAFKTAYIQPPFRPIEDETEPMDTELVELDGVNGGDNKTNNKQKEKTKEKEPEEEDDENSESSTNEEEEGQEEV